MNLSEIIFEKPGAQIKMDVILSRLRQDLLPVPRLKSRIKYTQFD